MEAGLPAMFDESGSKTLQHHQRPLFPIGWAPQTSLTPRFPLRRLRSPGVYLTFSRKASANRADSALHGDSPSPDFHEGERRRSLLVGESSGVSDGWALDGLLPSSLTLGKTIGSGSFGVVRGATCRETGRQYAVKVLKKKRTGYPTDVLRAKIDNEVSVWMEMHECHEVVRLHKCYEDDEHVYLVQDCCTGGSLEDVLKAKSRLSEPEAAHVISGILRMVSRCHEQSICYGDIKPSNFLVASPRHAVSDAVPAPPISKLLVKAVDFGSAQRTRNGEGRLTGEFGTPLYAAPEVQDPPYGLESDVWSAGVLLYQLLSGRAPFVDAVAKTPRELNPASLAYAIAYVKLTFDGEPWDEISDDAKDLISKMLERNVSIRIKAEEALQHLWILEHQADAGTDVKGHIIVNEACDPASQGKKSGLNGQGFEKTDDDDDDGDDKGPFSG